MRISDWSSDVCSSDLGHRGGDRAGNRAQHAPKCRKLQGTGNFKERAGKERGSREKPGEVGEGRGSGLAAGAAAQRLGLQRNVAAHRADRAERRSEEHTSELQSLMRISYAVFCLKKKTNTSN